MEGRIIHISQKVAKSKRIGNRRKGKLKRNLICELWELQKERKRKQLSMQEYETFTEVESMDSHTERASEDQHNR